MAYEIEVTDLFEKQLKKLAKKSSYTILHDIFLDKKITSLTFVVRKHKQACYENRNYSVRN